MEFNASQAHSLSNRIRDGGADLLGPCLAHLSSIQKLDLTFNEISDDCSKALRLHLAHLTTEQLKLDSSVPPP